MAPEHVVRACGNNAHRVIGVVRGTVPGFEPEFWEVVVGGEVRCKVLGRVAPGDLLVPSALEGFARRARWFARRGTILGKAISNHAPLAPIAHNSVLAVISLH